jgi:tripartite-type tricarboxylate transporter receptor subunit TctC
MTILQGHTRKGPLRRLAVGLVASGLAVAAPQALAQEYPEPGKPISVIVAASAGSGMDVTARLATDALAGVLEGANFQVINRPGAGTQVGIQELADSPNDGYTFGVISLPTAVTLTLDPARQAKFNRDSFEPIANFIYDPGAIAVLADSPYRSLTDLVEAAKAKPGEVTVGVTGPRGREHLDVTALEQATSVQFTPVFHNDSGLALNSLLGGNIAAVQGSVGDFLSQMKAGRVRLLAVFDRQPSSFAPDVPTAESQGYPIFSGVTRGFAFPAGAPPEAVARVGEAMKTIAESPEQQEKIKNMGFELRFMDAEEYGRYWDSEVERSTELMKKIPS